MNRAPFITGDGILSDVSEVHFDSLLAAPRVSGVMTFHNTSDILRGLVRDLCDRATAEQRPFSDYLEISGRSGHSRMGLDVRLGQGHPLIKDTLKRLELPVEITALNSVLGESLADLRILSSRESVGLGRLFIPLGPCLSRSEIEQALADNLLLLPEAHSLGEDGVIEIGLDRDRYILSSRLLQVPYNFMEMVSKGKHGLSLVQNLSPAGLPPFIGPKEFMVGAVRISFGPFSALIERELSDPRVFHLASRLLDGVRTSGIEVPRQVEIYNKGDEPVPTSGLKIRLRLYPGEERVAKLAARLFSPRRAVNILRRGVDFSELADIFQPQICNTLFDEITSSPARGGYFGRILMPEKAINIPWEEENSVWLKEFQWRLVYEYSRGNLKEGVLDGEEIPGRLRGFIDDLRYIGGEQKLSKIFVAFGLPPVDTLRVLKRNGIGVVVIRGVQCEDEAVCETMNLCLDQPTYEELWRLEKEGMRFYLFMHDAEEPQVREFFHGLWVTESGRERLENIHTTVAMFGSTLDSLKDLLRGQFEEFLSGLKNNPALGESLAVAHGSGPGVMKVVDEVASELGIFRIGVGIDAEEIGQAPNFRPEAIVQFVNLAMNTRQDILDRRSIFKVFNIGGFGTSYEINMALTFMKIGHCLPAPYIFVDPLGLGDNGSGIWEQSIAQFKALSRPIERPGFRIEPLGPRWVVNCCHLVRNYSEGLLIVENFLADPAAYWKANEIPDKKIRLACQNLRKAGVPIPPYIEAAVKKLGQL